ncbi:MAG: hypothetical protein EHM79_00895 [Geobacter sp.]|nr:MAG: hypothetical protein EHM79_00895 [Geobacter sp.]
MDTGNYSNAGRMKLPGILSGLTESPESAGPVVEASVSSVHSPEDSFSERAHSSWEEIKGAGRSLRDWISDNIIGEEPDYHTGDRMKKIIGIGVTAGGAAGTAAGYVYGLANESNNKVNEVWNSHDVDDPVKLLGWSHKDIEDGHTESHTYYTLVTVSHTGYDGNGNSYTYYSTEIQPVTYYTYEHDGYWHRNLPNIEWKKVGEYKTPALVHERSIGPIEGAAIGLGIGLFAGLVIGVITAHIHKLITQNKEGVGK